MIRIILKYFLLFCLCLTSYVSAEQLQKSFNIENFYEDTFSQLKAIIDLEQDQQGFLWIASTTGLFKFDGYVIKEYKPNKTPNSLPHFQINQILKDFQNRIWVGTALGLVIYHKESDDFIKVKLNRESIQPVITKIIEDSNKNIWVGTRSNGLYMISKSHDSIEEFNTTSIEHKISSDLINAIYEDNNGNIWIGTGNGLDLYSVKNRLVTQYLTSKTNKRLDFSIIDGPNDNMLVGTKNGIFILQSNENRLVPFLISNSDVSSKEILMLKKGLNNEILIGTGNNGLYIYSPDTNTTVNINNDGDSKNALKSGLVRTALIDNKKNVWLGTNSGISKINLSSKLFEVYRSENNNIECLSNNKSFAVYVDEHNTLWVGVVGKGLHRIDLKRKTCKLYDYNNIGLAGVKLDYILDMKSDIDGNIWIANYSEGLIKLNTETQIFSRVNSENPEINNLLSNSFIYKIDIDNEKNIWLAMSKQVLLKISNNTKSIQLMKNEIEQKLGKTIVSAKSIQHFKNKIWLGTIFQGIVSYDIKTGEVSQFVRQAMDQKGIPEHIRALRMDKNGILWIGTSGYGLYKFDTNTKKYTNYRTDDGLADDVIWNIEVDSNDMVWIGTNNGTSVFNQKTNKFTNYYESDGLQANESTTSGYYDPKSKTIWTGGINGINKIRTDRLSIDQKSRAVVFTDLKINYKPVSIDPTKENSPLTKNINIADELELNYQQNNFSFTYASIDFNNAERIRYQYKLDGYDDWKETSATERIASYTNIDPGKYVFKVRATLTDSWDGEEKSINIVILPPWWKTNTAYFIYFVSLMTSLYLLIYLRTRSLKKRSIELEEEVKVRTRELVQEKSKVEQLLSRKNEEFANVSHEFRTPLTLILGPLAQVLKTNKNTDEISRLNIVQRNGYRLLRMVDQLLNMETFRIKSITQKSPQAIGKTVQLLSDAFADLANDKNISLSLKRILDVNFSFTPDAFEKILLNLLSNAIKYTKSGGSITVDCERTHNNEFKLEVMDTGIGIPADKLDSVFERYNRVLDENSEQVTGAGIGLALVKELVEAHQGRIEIASELGKGTTITVYLPIIDEVSENEVKRHNTDEIVAMELMSLTNQRVEATTTSIQNSAHSSSDKPSVLVIEDNSDMRDYIANSISDEYLVLTAKDGEEGVAIAIEQVPDLIISDIMMPKKDGYQTTQELRNNSATNHIPIILLTARGDRESRLKGWYEKADEYLTKPFDVEELKIRLKNLLDIREILRKRFAETAFEQTPQLTPVSSDDVDENKEILQFGFIQQLNQELERLHTETSTTVAEIAATLHMSERQFFRKVKSVVDMTPSDYLRRFRLEKAKVLLTEGKNANFSAYEVGFSSQSYFGKCFKAQFGMSPKEFVKSIE